VPGQFGPSSDKPLRYLHDVLRALAGFAYVALRFLPQASYEQAAQMPVSAAPDVVTRTFVPLRAIAPGKLDLWKQAAAGATEALRSGNGSSASIWRARRIAACSVFWSGRDRGQVRWELR
jgi:hypothetical protein